MSASSTEDHAPPSPTGSSASDGSSSVSTGPPRTPVSSSLPLSMPTFMNFTGENGIAGFTSGGVKRTAKTNRRINSAERRATHNAVERQRRETLNGRFLDLAALLVNLQQIRRPSKSAIVNSSIAHLKASRRHRILAAQQLRMMKQETDLLRHELNEWRARAGVPFSEEPPRGEAFGIVLSGELEFEPGDMLNGTGDGEGEEEEEDGSGGAYGHEGRYGYGADPRAYDQAAAEEYAQFRHRRQQEYTLQIHAQGQPFGLQMHPEYPPSRVDPSSHYYGTSTMGYNLPTPIPLHAESATDWVYDKQQMQGSW